MAAASAVDWEVVDWEAALGVATVAERVASTVATQGVAERGWAVAERVAARAAALREGVD